MSARSCQGIIRELFLNEKVLGANCMFAPYLLPSEVTIGQRSKWPVIIKPVRTIILKYLPFEIRIRNESEISPRLGHCELCTPPIGPKGKFNVIGGKPRRQRTLPITRRRREIVDLQTPGVAARLLSGSWAGLARDNRPTGNSVSLLFVGKCDFCDVVNLRRFALSPISKFAKYVPEAKSQQRKVRDRLNR